MTERDKAERIGFTVTPAKLGFLMSLVAALGLFYTIFGAYFELRGDTKIALDAANDAKRMVVEYTETNKRNYNELSKQIQALSDNIQQLALILREVQTVQRVQPPKF